MQHNLLSHAHVEEEEQVSEVALLVSKIERMATEVFGRKISDVELAQILAELAMEEFYG